MLMSVAVDLVLDVDVDIKDSVFTCLCAGWKSCAFCLFLCTECVPVCV